jgi:hypothetical protein
MFKELHNKFEGDISKLECAFIEISKIFNKLPIGDSFKKPLLQHTLKEKSAWYACLVNQNIDILLLPEFLESKVCRNILLKKETEQYHQSFEQFADLNTKSPNTLYEILLKDNAAQIITQSFDLFSSNVHKTIECPNDLKLQFNVWEKETENYNELEEILFTFIQWHTHNHFNFSNQRQIILWLNYRLWKLYGSIVFNINLERYFYHHYNKESRSIGSALKELIDFIVSELQNSKTILLNVFRTHIKFEELSTSEKIASNHLFYSVFETNLPSKFVQNITLSKTLLKRGFLKLEDFSNPIECEKLSPQVEELLALNFIELKKENNSICLCLNTQTKETSRLGKYNNMPLVKEKMQLNHFLEQIVFEKELHKPIISVLETTTPKETLVSETIKERKKVFFG